MGRESIRSSNEGRREFTLQRKSSDLVEERLRERERKKKECERDFMRETSDDETEVSEFANSA